MAMGEMLKQSRKRNKSHCLVSTSSERSWFKFQCHPSSQRLKMSPVHHRFFSTAFLTCYKADGSHDKLVNELYKCSEQRRPSPHCIDPQTELQDKRGFLSQKHKNTREWKMNRNNAAPVKNMKKISSIQIKLKWHQDSIRTINGRIRMYSNVGVQICTRFSET